MYIKRTDEMLLEINNIKNIRSIKIYDLLITKLNNTYILPSVLVVYDGKVLNLCSKDEYFDELVNKLIDVYNKEKDKKYIDDFGREIQIDIDEKTKNLLLSGKLTKNSKYDFYRKKESYDDNFVFQIDEVRLLIPILKYQLESFFKYLNKVLVIDSTLYGYRDNYNMRSKIDGLDTIMILFYKKIDNDRYIIWTKGLLSNNKVIENSIRYSRERIEILSSIDDITYSNVVNINDNEILSKIYSGYRLLVDERKILERVKNPYPNVLHNKYYLYKLPWGYIGKDIRKKSITDNENVYLNDIVYISNYEDSFNIRNYYYKEYEETKKDNSIGKELLLDNINKCVNGIKVDDQIYLISTYFDQVGFYKTLICNKYFYHLAKAKCLEEIDLNTLVSIDKKEFIDRTDVLDLSKVSKVMK